ncbi:ssrAB-activated protein [Buttiauxella warmboldiae]|uniref:SsrAB-activated protein n=1 Tax=Buttiauxella warmboldiae TaxID=82993 RepID=A0A3N5DPV3_9ENTR|nr:SrfA family protein [Buttiauxella warmboldiae]RPH29241.1 ssrAB-activated protein [Buttiauxella warmboldiae]
MSGIILRSGYLNDFIALGESGQTLFETAIQIRETIRLQKQQALFDCLAIPQHNDVEEKVDWYAPYEGDITPWASASERQREFALSSLENCLSAAGELSQRYLCAEKASLRLFGSMLTKLLQFPGSQYIYLVDDKPVIAFWGFLNRNQSPREDVFDCLRTMKSSDRRVLLEPVQEIPEEPEEIEFPDPKPAIVKISQPDTPLLQPVFQTPDLQAPEHKAEQPQPEAISQTGEKKTRPFRLFRLLKVIAVLMIFAAFQMGYSYVVPRLSSYFDITHVSATAAPEMVTEVQPVRLPVQPATVSAPAPVKKIDPVPPVAMTSAEVRIDKNLLVLPADAVKIGSSAFMDGRWKASINASSTPDIRQPTLHLRIKNSKGTLKVNLDNKVACKADIYLGLMQSGNLQIKSRSRAKCNDKSRYQIPEITCKQGASGAAQCAGRYADDTLVPMTLLKVGK